MAVKEDKVQVSVMVDGKQAINELGKMELEAYELRQSLKGMKRDTEEYVKASEKLDKVEEKMKSMRKEMGVKAMTMRELTAHQKELNREISIYTAGTAKHTELKNRLVQVNQAIGQQRDEVRGLGGAWSMVKSEVMQFGLLAGGFMAATWIVDQISSIVKGNGKLTDSLASVMKTTGMTKDEVAKLNSELGKIDTRTKTADLREMARVAGQLGIAKEDVRDFVEATDMAVLALGDDFGGGAETVAREMGMLQKLFKDTAELSPAEAISRIGSAVNELGAAGTATAPEIAAFTRRIGALGELAPSISETLGLGAAFEELGLTAERSSSGLSTILLEAAGSSDKFAKMMGKTNDEVKALINSNPNKFILELAERFKGLSQTQATEVMAKLGINGQEAIKVLSLLADKTDFVREKQELAAVEMKKNESLQKEANVQQETFGALLDRIGKKINSLTHNAAMTKFLEDAAVKTYKLLVFLKDLPKFLDQNKETFYALGLAMIYFNRQAIITNALSIKTAAVKAYETIALKANVIAWRLIAAAMYANPIGIVIGLLFALGTALITAYNNSEKFRAGIAGIWAVLQELASFISDSFGNTIMGLYDMLDGFMTGNKKVIKEGQDALKKGLNNLSPAGFKQAGQRLATAFSVGYNDSLELENPKPPMEIVAPKRKKAEAEKVDTAWADEYLTDEEKTKKGKTTKDDSAKKAEDERKRLRDQLRLLQDLEIAMMDDLYEQKRRKAQLQFEREIEDLKEKKLHSIEIEKLLQQQLHRELAEIDREQKEEALKRSLEQSEGRADLQAAMTQAQDAKNKELEQLTLDLQERAIMEIDHARWKAEQLFLIEQQALQNKIDLWEGGDEKQLQQRELAIIKLDEMQAMHNANQLQMEQQRISAMLALQQRKFDISSSLLESWGSSMTGVMQIVGANSAELAEFQKLVTFAQLMIDTASAISAVTAMNAKTSMTPLDYAVRVAAAIGTVLGNIGKARALLSQADTPDKPNMEKPKVGPKATVKQLGHNAYYFGGKTGKNSIGFGDQYGEFAGMVHQDEYVIDHLTRKDPAVANMEAIIESKRTGQRGSFIAEQQTGSSGDNGQLVALMQMMVASQEQAVTTMRNWNTRVRADISLTQFEEAQNTKRKLQEETEF